MSQSGFTPIQLFRTSTASAAPSAGNLAAGELAINLTDEKLYFKNAAGTVKLLASNSGSAGSVTSVGGTGTVNGITLTGTVTSSGNLTLGGTLSGVSLTTQVTGTLPVANGGTGATSLTSGYLVKGNGTSAVSASVVYDDGTNVGIGTATPVSRLDVSGTTGFTWAGGGTSSGLVTVGTQGTGGSLFVNTASASAPFASGLAVDGTYSSLSSVVNLKAVGVNSGGGYTGSIAFHTTSGTALSEKMRIDGSGNVIIGGVSANSRLDVNGDITIRNGSGVIIGNAFNNSGWMDFAGSANVNGTQVSTAAATPVRFLTNSTERMRIDSSGNLLVGTTTATGKLTVAGTGGTATVGLLETGVRSWAIRAGGTATNNFDIADLTAGATRFVIDASGNVGIGASSPSTKLDVVGGGVANGAIQALAQLKSASDAISNSVEMLFTPLISGQTRTAIGGVREGATSNAAIYMATNNAERMRIDASGNVGIGTTAPGYRLDVAAGDTTANTGYAMRLRSNATATAAAIQFTNAAVSNENGLISCTDVGALTIQANGGSSNTRFRTNGSERAYIGSNGNFGIGTSTRLGTNETLSVSAISSFDGMWVKNLVAAAATTVIWNAATSGDNLFISFGTEASVTARGSITYNRGGGLVAYNVTSDYRAKDIIGPVTDAGATIDALKVYDGKMKGAAIVRPMLIAHEAQEVTPYAVTGKKDAVNEDGTDKYQQMDHQSLIPLLIAELQSLRARVAQLEGKPA